jgi:hypothetical protein
MPTETCAWEYAAGTNKIESKAKYLRIRIFKTSWPVNLLNVRAGP